MNSTLSGEQKESLRHAVLEVLVSAYPAALHPRAILREACKLVPFTPDESDLQAVLAVLQELKLVAGIPDQMGPTTYWAATAAGVLQTERGN